MTDSVLFVRDPVPGMRKFDPPLGLACKPVGVRIGVDGPSTENSPGWYAIEEWVPADMSALTLAGYNCDVMHCNSIIDMWESYLDTQQFIFSIEDGRYYVVLLNTRQKFPT